MADHWGGHPSSPQYIGARLPETVSVLWLETVGVVGPQLSWDDLLRGLAQMRRWLRPPPVGRHNAGQLRLLSPRLWPGWKSAWQQGCNGRILARTIERALVGKAGRRILVSTLPLAASVLDRFDFDRVVYYCVDDFSAWPGAHASSLLRMEQRLLARSDVIIAASRRLQERCAEMGHRAYLLPHGVDAGHWRRPVRIPSAAHALRDLPRPLLLFWGLIDARLDTEWIRACREATAGSVVLVGPTRSPDPALLAAPGVTRIGAVPYDDLPAYAEVSDVLIMPYADLAVTRAMQPLKLFEYLSTDRPVVIRDLPACAEWADAADVVGTRREFCDAVLRRLREGVPPEQLAARLSARERSWQEVADRFMRLVAAD